MSLSERLRDCEAAPWVIGEIKKIEIEIEAERAKVAELEAMCRELEESLVREKERARDLDQELLAIHQKEHGIRSVFDKVPVRHIFTRQELDDRIKELEKACRVYQECTSQTLEDTLNGRWTKPSYEKLEKVNKVMLRALMLIAKDVGGTGSVKYSHEFNSNARKHIAQQAIEATKEEKDNE